MSRRTIKEIELGDNEVFDIEDKYSRDKITELSNNVNTLLTNYDKLPLKESYNANILTVAKSGGMFNTINDAFNYAHNTLNPSNNKRVTILIFPGIYNEKLVADEWNYIDFIGIDKYSCIIEYASVYPDCVIHIHGDNTFKNLTIRSTSTASYCIHADYQNNTNGYYLEFDNCIITGGSNAIGHGSSQNSTLIIKNCKLEGSQYPLYFHNCPYNNTTNQNLILINNEFGAYNNQCMLIDDSAYGYGVSNSYLMVTANGNYCKATSPIILFRLIPGNDEYNSHYIPEASMIKLTTSSQGNFNESIDFGGGVYNITAYVVLPANANTAGWYQTSIPTGDLFATRYNRNLMDVTLPGVGSVTNDFGIGGVTDHFIELTTNNSGYAGKTVSVSIQLTAG